MPKKSKKVDESFEAQLSKERIMSSTDEARSLYDKSRFGEIKENKVQYSLSEGIYY